MSQLSPQGIPLENLLAFLSDDPENWNLRADVFDAALAAGRSELALAQVERALSVHPQDPFWRHRQAMFFLATRQYGEAQLVLESLIAEGQDHPAVRHNLAYALYAQGRMDAASTTLEPLLPRVDVESAPAWVLWLRCQHHLHRTRECLEALRGRLRKAPVPIEALGVASLVAIDEEFLEEAKLWSKVALESRPDQPEALVTRGSLALLARDANTALECFQRALQVNPSDGRSWSGVAMSRALQHDLRGADEAFRNAVVTMPSHVGTWITWGWCQGSAGSWEAARTSFMKALELDRNFGESHGSLAVALAALGDREQAAKEIELARRLDPRGLSAQYAEAMLAGKATDEVVLGKMVRVALARAAPTRRASGGSGTST